jgi:DNA invertase Pin-like site-specific DNA recombinase
MSPPSLRRAIGIVRVSRLGEDAVSPLEQRERIASTCSRDGLDLVDTFEELDVSGGAQLEQRPGLRRAVRMVEEGEADVVVVAYFDRLVRSLAVQAEVVERVERAVGRSSPSTSGTSRTAAPANGSRGRCWAPCPNTIAA